MWGLRMIKTGMLRAFGASLRQWIARSTSNRLLALAAGFGATLLVQSSTATAVITASFAGRELLTASMAQAVMLGANLGTSLVAIILSADLGWLSPALIAIGVGIHMRGRRATSKGVARAILGLGLMLLALELMGQATEPLQSSPLLGQVLGSLDSAPVLGLILGAGLAFLSASSLVVVLFVVLLAAAGVVTPALAMVLVAGANLGGAVPPFLAVSGEGAVARRVAMCNLLVRAFGAVVLTFAAPYLAGPLMALGLDVTGLVLATHFGFSLVLALVFLPLLSPLVRLGAAMVPADPVSDAIGPRYLEDAALSSPAIALSAAARETLRLGDLVRTMLEESLAALRHPDPAAGESLGRVEDEIDTLHSAIKSYLSRLGREELDADDTRWSTEIMSYAINLEHVGDIIDNGLSDLVTKKARRQLLFSDEGMAEIEALYAKTFEVLQLAQSVFLSRDAELARQLADAKVDIRRMEAESAAGHLDRLRHFRTEAVETSGLHLDILRDLKRVNAHLISVAYPILDDLGALRESRLRSSAKTAKTEKTAKKSQRTQGTQGPQRA